MTVLEINKLIISKIDNGRSLVIMNNIGFKVERGSIVSFMGEETEAKDKLRKIVMCMKQPEYANYYIDRIEVNIQSEKERNKIRNRYFGISDVDCLLDEHSTVYDNVSLILILKGKTIKKEIVFKVRKALAYVGMDWAINSDVHKMDTYQKRLISLAAAICDEPKIVFLNEVLNGFNSWEKCEYIKILRKLTNEGFTFICFSNDLLMGRCSDQRFFISDGKLESKTGAPDENEFNEYIEEFYNATLY